MEYDLALARLRAGLSVSEAAEMFGRTVRTWRRWENEATPDWVLPMLRLAGGDLGWFDWHGWRIGRDGRLYSDQIKYWWDQGSLFASFWDKQRIRAYQLRLDEVERAAGWNRASAM